MPIGQALDPVELRIAGNVAFAAPEGTRTSRGR